MLRLVGFFAVVFIAHSVLGALPVVGDVLHSLGIFSFWAVALLVSFCVSRFGERWVQGLRMQREIQELSLVDTPGNQGKLGLLQLKRGQPRAAIEQLGAAFEAQPHVAEWSFGLGRAHQALGQWQSAGEFFARSVVEDSEHGFGAAYLGLARAAFELGRAADALQALEEHDRRQGEVSRSAFLRGRALKSLGRVDEARAAFGRVLELHGEQPAYQRRGQLGLVLKSIWLRRF